MSTTLQASDGSEENLFGLADIPNKETLQASDGSEENLFGLADIPN